MGVPFLVSVHIPKTAGTTLASVLDRCLQRRIMYDYADYAGPQVAPLEIRENAGFIQTYFHAIHGHFLASKYFDVFPDAAFVATLRHPVTRVISHFRHELNEASCDAWYHGDIVAGRMDVVEFAQQDGIGNAISRHLAGRDLRDYAALLIAEHFVPSCQLLSIMVRPLNLEMYFGVPPQLPSLNRANQRPNSVEVDQKTREAIFAQTRHDNDLYAAAIALLKERAARFLR